MGVVVTGGAGFIGSWVVDKLLEKGFEVSIIDNLSTGKRENLNPKAEFIEEDITGDIWERLPKYDCVFHIAALPRIQPSIADPVPPHNANVNGTLNVLEYCRKHGSKLIFSSSSSIFSGEVLPTNEDSPTHPRSPYALQKLICEQYIELYRELYGLDAVILRYFNVYGERQLLAGSYATALGIFLNQHSHKKPLTINGDGLQRRDFTYVGDVADANLLATNWTGNFNIGRGKNYSIKEIADLISDWQIHLPRPKGEVQDTFCDNRKAKEAGWKPKMEIKSWLASL